MMGAKYPAFDIQGHKVLTPDETLDFILRFDTFLGNALKYDDFGNQKGVTSLFNYEIGFNQLIREIAAEIHPERELDFAFSVGRFHIAECVEKAIGYRCGRTIYLSCISSSSLGGLRPWLNVKTGEICGSTSCYSKWSSGSDIYDDLLYLATDFPYLDMTVTIWDGPERRDVEFQPVCSVRIKGGELSVVETNKLTSRSFKSAEVFSGIDLMPEFGVSVEWFEKYKASIKKLIAGCKNKAIAISNEPYEEEDY